MQKTLCFLFALALSIYAQPSDKKKIAVYKFTSDELSKSQTTELSKFVTDELRNYPNYEVMDWANVGQILGFVNDQQALAEGASDPTKANCTSDRCFAELGNRLGVEEMIVGSISKIGDRYLVNLSLQDVENVKVLGTAKSQIRGNMGDILDSLPQMLQRVMSATQTKVTPVPVTPPISTKVEAPKTEPLQTLPKPEVKPKSKLKSWLFWGGASTAILGGLYFLDRESARKKAQANYDLSTSDEDWNTLNSIADERNTAVILTGLGGLGFALSFAF